jgi:hypothetical protein
MTTRLTCRGVEQAGARKDANKNNTASHDPDRSGSLDFKEGATGAKKYVSFLN